MTGAGSVPSMALRQTASGAADGQGPGTAPPREALRLTREYGVSTRLTFSNSLLREEHLSDWKCNEMCRLFEEIGGPRNGVIVHSELLLEFLKKRYPGLYFVSSATKVLTDFQQFRQELARHDFLYVVPDFRLNKAFDRLNARPEGQKAKVEFLCNECCRFGCKDRKACYEAVSRKNLGETGPEHRCAAPGASGGYRFSRATTNPGFISADNIRNVYLPMGFSHFKIEGRSLGSVLILEFLLYYLTKPEYYLRVREEIYLDNMLDLFQAPCLRLDFVAVEHPPYAQGVSCMDMTTAMLKFPKAFP